MPDVPSLLARRLAGRCLTAKLALLAGFLALQATAGTALAQEKIVTGLQVADLCHRAARKQRPQS